MHQASQKQDFEKAKTLRDQIFALENVFLHSHILERGCKGAKLLPEKELSSFTSARQITRIEGYDISNIQGQEATGSMVVFENGLPNKNEYRRFHIKMESKPNDTAMIKEVLARRLKHKEWLLPQIMLIDGGKAQLNTAIKTVYRGRTPVNLEIVALAKRKNELFLKNRQKPVLLKSLPQETANLILRIRDEAHRFAIAYHKKLRSKNFLQ